MGMPSILPFDVSTVLENVVPVTSSKYVSLQRVPLLLSVPFDVSTVLENVVPVTSSKKRFFAASAAFVVGATEIVIWHSQRVPLLIYKSTWHSPRVSRCMLQQATRRAG